MQKGDDPYEILGVNEDATTSEIRKAYRKLAVVHHPDKQTTDEGRKTAHDTFARIACAYELLSDEDKRKEYDEQQDEAPEDEHPGFDGNATYDYPFDPDRNAGSTAIVPATTKTGKPFNPFRRKPKKAKPMHFSDPYEVFKRAFKEEFGYEYPGAKWDNIDPDGQTVQARAKNAPLAIENGPAGSGGDGDNEKKKKKGIMTLFKRKKDDQQLTVYKGDGKGGKDGTVANANKPPPGNNRPVSMETKTTKIEHDDGTIETITETTITRPDGSTETMRQTDKPEKKTHNWTKPKEGAGGDNNVKKLTSGKEGQKMLTNGSDNKKRASSTKKKPVKQITDGKKKGKEKPLAIKNG